MVRYIMAWMLGLITVMPAAYGQGIEFEDETVKDLLVRSGEEHKYLFVDCYTTWCAPCKKMDTQVFTLKTVGDTYNDKFLNLKLDMESKEGKAFKEKYEVQAYPTYIILNSTGEVVLRSCGYMPEGKFIEFANNALSATSTLTVMQKRFDNGERDPEFLYVYFKALQGGCYPFMKLVVTYLDGLSAVELSKAANWRMFSEFSYNADDAHAKLFLSQPSVFVKVQSKKAVYNKGMELYQKKIQQYYKDISGNKAKAHAQYKSQLDAADPVWRNHVLALAELYYQEANGNWKEYAHAARTLVKTFNESQLTVLNDIGVVYLHHIKDEKQLKEALGWAKPIYTETTNPMYYLTYAALLYKTGNKEESDAVKAQMLKYGEEVGANLGFLQEKLEEYKH